MKQQTAVDWLFTTLDNILELYPSEWEKISKAVEQAKAMEKEQIINAVDYVVRDIDGTESGEQYYNETYNK
jgi:hypothetical protein